MTVSQLNQRVKSLLERQHPQVTVIGELSAPRISGGHCYFKLKDGGAVVAGVMFRGQLSRLGFKVEHGLQVVIEGRVTLYAPSGQYQVVAEKMSLQGQGNLQQAFDALKELSTSGSGPATQPSSPTTTAVWKSASSLVKV